MNYFRHLTLLVASLPFVKAVEYFKKACIPPPLPPQIVIAPALEIGPEEIEACDQMMHGV